MFFALCPSLPFSFSLCLLLYLSPSLSLPLSLCLLLYLSLFVCTFCVILLFCCSVILLFCCSVVLLFCYSVILLSFSSLPIFSSLFFPSSLSLLFLLLLSSTKRQRYRQMLYKQRANRIFKRQSDLKGASTFSITTRSITALSITIKI